MAIVVHGAGGDLTVSGPVFFGNWFEADVGCMVLGGGVLVCIGKDSGQQVVMTLSMVEIVGRWGGWSISMKMSFFCGGMGMQGRRDGGGG